MLSDMKGYVDGPQDHRISLIQDELPECLTRTAQTEVRSGLPEASLERR